MKKVTRIVALTMMLVLCVAALTACSNKYPQLKSAFEKEGFEENQAVEGVADQIKQDMAKDELEVNVHVLTKNEGVKPSVMIIEFKATEDLVKAYQDSNTMQGLVKDVQESEDVNALYQSLVDAGFACGNCLCIPLSVVYYKTITEIVKGVSGVSK